MRQEQKHLKWELGLDYKSIKMKKLGLFIMVLLSLTACSSVDECMKSSGEEVFISKTLPFFDKVIIHSGIGLVVSQQEIPEVILKTTTHLSDNIEMVVIDETLIVKDLTSCNWIRPYGQTQVILKLPNLIKIESYSEQDVVSDGFLNFPYLNLVGLEKGSEAASGNFIIHSKTDQLVVECNTIASFFLMGETNFFKASYYAGNGRIEASNLLAQEVAVFHRSSQDFIVNPIQKVTGNLYSTGNLVLKNVPPEVDVNQFFTGRLIENP